MLSTIHRHGPVGIAGVLASGLDSSGESPTAETNETDFDGVPK